jgi:hypothetical protein
MHYVKTSGTGYAFTNDDFLAVHICRSGHGEKVPEQFMANSAFNWNLLHPKEFTNGQIIQLRQPGLNFTPTLSKPLPRLRSGAYQLLALVVIGAVGGAEIPSIFHRFSVERGGYFFTLGNSGPAVVAALYRLLRAFLRRIGLDLFVAASRTVAPGIRFLLLTRTSCPSSLQNAVSRHCGRAKEQQQ